MNKNKKREKTMTAVVHKTEVYLPEAVISDLRTCFDYYDKNKRNEISRDNVKSIMENFGWLNRPNKELEACIETIYPSMDDKRKKDVFSFEEINELIAEFWIRRGYMENEFGELFSIFDKK